MFPFGRSALQMIGGDFPSRIIDKNPPLEAVKVRYDINEAFNWGCEPIGPVSVLENCGCVVYKCEFDNAGNYAFLWVDHFPTDDVPEFITELKAK